MRRRNNEQRRGARARQPALRGNTAPLLCTEVQPLKRVILHSPGPETHAVVSVLAGEHPMLVSDVLGHAARAQYKYLEAALENSQVELLFVKNLLNEAIRRSRAAGELEPWLAAKAPRLVERAGAVTANALLGGCRELVYHVDDAQQFRPLAAPMRWMLFTRDTAVMTPAGVVLCNFIDRSRAFEAELVRFAFAWSPSLRGYPIAFDAIGEQAYVQGGDILVMNQRTLLVGVGNMTSEQAARRLARRLGMDVIAVRLPNSGWLHPGMGRVPLARLRRLFLRLSTFLCFIDERTVLAAPYLLEAEHAGRDPLTRLLAGLAREPGVDEQAALAVRDRWQDVGWIQRYLAGSGDLDPSLSNIKLVDYLRLEGYRMIHVGGPLPAASSALEHMVERVLRELRFQAANVVPVAPGRVIAYEGNPYTLAALRAAGVEVLPMPAHELMRWNGGPHCLTMPLERGPG